MSLRAVGIDPSLTGTGIATSIGWCTTVGRDGVTTLALADRLAAVDALVDEILLQAGRLAGDLFVIEEPAFSRTGGGAVERHALWWLLVRRLVRGEARVALVKPRSRMRYATGKGAATKQAVVDAVARRLPMFETGGDDNLCDAAVLCAMGRDWLGAPLVKMPEAHREALSAVIWPETGGAS